MGESCVLYNEKNCTEMLVNAVSSVLGHEFVKNPSQDSQEAVETATGLLQWIEVPENRVLFRKCATELICTLKQSFKCCKLEYRL